jgi:transposase-like protein
LLNSLSVFSTRVKNSTFQGQPQKDLIGENGLLSGNTRNGKSKTNLKGDFGELPIEVPRDRYGSFEPQPIPKHQTR